MARNGSPLGGGTRAGGVDVVAMMALVAGLVLLLPSLTFPSGMPVSFEEIAFDLPGSGWQPTGGTTPQRIQHTRGTWDGRSQSIAVWSVTFPPSLRGRTQQEHTSAYFEFERRQPRYENGWEGFVEGTREIAGRQFPTLSFTVTLPSQRFVMDGLLVLYFPDDFDRRGKFFALMWMDGHPQDQPGAGLDALDAIVASVRIY